MYKTGLVLIQLTLMLTVPCLSQDGWEALFNGSSLDGWTASENPDSFKVENGVIVCGGPRAHLFYTGEDGEAMFRNFEFRAKVKTTPGSNSGIFFHTKFQDSGWPSNGYEAQVYNSTRPGQAGYLERKKTGSLYAVRNVWNTPAKDNEWFDYSIVVQGKTIRIFINDRLVVDYTEPDNSPAPEGSEGRVLSSGTFALQCHDPESTVFFKDLQVRKLPNELSSPGIPPADSSLNQRLTELGGNNFPLVDYHVHLKGDLTTEDLLAKAREYGFTYGIAFNCGLKNPLPNENSVRKFLAEYERIPGTYLAMQAEGREWMDLFTRESIEKFDYVITDSMTVTDFNGNRMRLWMEDETEVGDPEEFMEMLVSRIEKILGMEMLDIYVNPTFLPAELQGRYDDLWTEERMNRVVQALADNGIAMEINAVRRIPSLEFIRRAKSKGVKFTFGTNNTGAEDLFDPSYWLKAIDECGLTPEDIWSPGIVKPE
jgi:hypothetical protein